MLELMSPWEYTSEIRPVLGHGSGFDSPGWNRIRHAAPALGEAFHALRREAGLSLADVYVQGREREDLYQLAEALTELDEWATTWRLRHFMVVERSDRRRGRRHTGHAGRAARQAGLEEALPGALEGAHRAHQHRQGERLSHPDAWGGATYERIAESFAPIHAELVAALRVQPGEPISRRRHRNGRRGAAGCAGRRRGHRARISPRIRSPRPAPPPTQAGLSIRFDEGDAQELPYEDESFDVVASAFGAIFAPDHERVGRAADACPAVTAAGSA